MSDMPLTRPAPRTEIPPDIETLWPELPSPARRQVHVTVTVPDRQLPVMDVVTSASNAAAAFAMAFDARETWDEFEVRATRFKG